jgi:hypothetical protein
MKPPPDRGAVSLLAELVRRRVELCAVAGRVRYRPRAAVPAALAAGIVRHKADLLRLLRERDEALEAITDADRQAANVTTWPTADRLATLPVGVRDLAGCRHGWTAAAWQDRLRQLAERCERDHPGRATELREAAAALTPHKNPRPT